MLIDLHTHSTASDGTQSPTELVRQAAATGIDVLGLTDHDTSAGWDAAVVAASQCGVTLVRGIEVSCNRDGTSVHLLSYLHDPAHAGLRAEMDASRRSREHRAQRMVERIAQDYPLSWDDVLAQVQEGTTIGRPHLADALVARGLFPSRDEAFATVLATGSRYHVSHYAPDPVDAVALVLAAGGVPVFAHPMAASRGRVVGEQVIEEMVQAGLAGVEVDHRDHDEAARRLLRDLAASHGLIVTGSSDYHGTGKPNRLAEHTTCPEQLARIAAAGALEVVHP